MGEQGGIEITPHDLAVWKGTVSYEIITAWRSRLPRIFINAREDKLKVLQQGHMKNSEIAIS